MAWDPLQTWSAEQLFGFHSEINVVRLFQILFCAALVLQTLRRSYDQLEYRRLARGGGSPPHVMGRRPQKEAWPLLGHETWPVFGLFDLRVSAKTYLYCFDLFRMSICLAAVGVAPRVMLASACVLYFGSFSQLVGLSYVRRKTNLFPFIFAILAVSPGIDSDLSASVPLWPIYLILVLLCMAYVNAGLTKLRVSGFSWVTSEAVQTHILEECLFKPNSFGMWFSTKPMLCRLLAAFSLFFELSYPIVLVLPWLMFPYGAIGALFHLGIFMTMKVDFIRYWSPIYLVFVVMVVEKLA